MLQVPARSCTSSKSHVFPALALAHEESSALIVPAGTNAEAPAAAVPFMKDLLFKAERIDSEQVLVVVSVETHPDGLDSGEVAVHLGLEGDEGLAVALGNLE